MTNSSQSEATISAAQSIVDDAWKEMQRSPWVQERLNIKPTKLPDISIEEVTRRSRVGRVLLERLDSINPDILPHDLALTLRLVRFRARSWSRELEWYWTVIDPFGEGYFGMFLPTAYCGGFLLDSVNRLFSEFQFAESGQSDRYL